MRQVLLNPRAIDFTHSMRDRAHASPPYALDWTAGDLILQSEDLPDERWNEMELRASHAEI